MSVTLTPKLKEVYRLYWVEGRSQVEIARLLFITQQAVSKRIQGVYDAYEERGIQLPRPGASYRTVTVQTLSGVWDRKNHEYQPTLN